MATQKCPRCDSNKIRRGYRPTSLLKKLTFRYNLLCDECNWEFSGFAIPGTVSDKTRKRKDKMRLGELTLKNETAEEKIENKDFLLSQKKSNKKRLKKKQIEAKESRN